MMCVNIEPGLQPVPPRVSDGSHSSPSRLTLQPVDFFWGGGEHMKELSLVFRCLIPISMSIKQIVLPCFLVLVA